MVRHGVFFRFVEVQVLYSFFISWAILKSFFAPTVFNVNFFSFSSISCVKLIISCANLLLFAYSKMSEVLPALFPPLHLVELLN